MAFSTQNSSRTPATAVYLNGNIYTVDEQNPKASAMVIADDRFIYIGSNETANGYIDDHTQVFDLNGQTVLPGLIDAHMHFGNVGNIKMKIDALSFSLR
jgi:predicted amidohydrolase YtcJ